MLAFYSLVLQVLYQSDPGLSQRCFVSEKSVRTQLVMLGRLLRNRSEFSPRALNRLAFQGIRLYLLICRSGHIRKQYVVLQPGFVEEERRTVAFLLSMSPPVQHCCVLLRAMAQDVHSWLLWQAQGVARPCSTRANQPRTRRRDGDEQRREVSNASHEKEVSLSNWARVAEKRRSERTVPLHKEPVEEVQRQWPRSLGHFVINGGFVIGVLACLLAVWASLPLTSMALELVSLSPSVSSQSAAAPLQSPISAPGMEANATKKSKKKGKKKAAKPGV